MIPQDVDYGEVCVCPVCGTECTKGELNCNDAIVVYSSKRKNICYFDEIWLCDNCEGTKPR